VVIKKQRTPKARRLGMGVGKLATSRAKRGANLPTPMPSLLAQQRKNKKAAKANQCGFWGNTEND
jgi:hypothetical protein